MNAQGTKELRLHNMGEKLTLKQMIKAKCAECMNNYADGKIDCGISECPLYPMMRYGGAWKGREKKIVSPLTLKSMRQGLKRVSTGVTND